MAERSQYQYNPVTGPVWREPVAEKLQWLPQGRHHPQRGLQPNRLGDFVQPAFDALYKAELLQWIPSDRYAGRPPAFSLTRHSVIEPASPAVIPRIDWWVQARYIARQLENRRYDLSVYPLQPPVAAYDPSVLDWQVRDSYFGKSLPQSLRDWFTRDPVTPAPAPPYDPQTLEWLPQGAFPLLALARPTQTWPWFQLGDVLPDQLPPQQPGGEDYRHFTLRPRNIYIARYAAELEPIDEIIEPETRLLEAVSETLQAAEAQAEPLRREISVLSALEVLSKAYGAHFDSAKAARAAIEERKAEIVAMDEEEIIAMMMIIAATDDST